MKRRELPADVAANVRRASTRCGAIAARGSAQGGPFLFGAFGAADAMYAPVVSRFHTYGVEVGAASRAYMEAVMALPAWGEWQAAALKEPWVLAQDEVDWPTVLRNEAACLAARGRLSRSDRMPQDCVLDRRACGNK